MAHKLNYYDFCCKSIYYPETHSQQQHLIHPLIKRKAFILENNKWITIIRIKQSPILILSLSVFPSEFDVEGDSQECPDNSDYAQVYNGLASWSPIIGRYCGKVIPSTIKSESNKLRIEFRSNTQYAGRGFDAVFTIQSDKQGN